MDFCSLPIAARRPPCAFFKRVVRRHGLPHKVTIDMSGVYTATIKVLKEETGQEIKISQIKYLNNRVEQLDLSKSDGSVPNSVNYLSNG
ncbi:MAG: hypothetical protein ACXWTS_09570 [Methylococcaceae bacterium]